MNDYFNQIRCGDVKRFLESIAFFDREFPTFADNCKESRSADYCYATCINKCIWMIDLWHFGFRGAVTPKQVVDKGVEIATTYFGLVGDQLAECGQQPSSTMGIRWFEPYSQALLLTTLGGRMRERTQFSDCLHANLVIEAAAAPDNDAALGDLLLCLASSFQSSPMDTSALQERIERSRKKRPKLLLSAWKALENNDKGKFASALADSTANFAKTSAEDHIPLTAVAYLESSLASLAYEHGWTDLSFELPIAARLVTHQSLGLT